MSSDKYIPTSDGKEIINPDGSSVSEIEGHQISKDTIPSFRKILVTDDGKDVSNIALNYAVALSNSTGAELYILRILKDVEKFGDVTVEGSHESSKIDNNDFHRHIKGDVIDAMEEKIKKCQEAGCKNKISYKFLTGHVVDEIVVKEINNNDYDLVVMSTSHIDSWFSSLFSDVRKIMNHISKPVLIIQYLKYFLSTIITYCN